ncbi:MAG: hypothetical protein NTV93_16780 [Verrucomicrobia bacterium]|nr:hypothetical protein [Verrucomicrobiota bacterium]
MSNMTDATNDRAILRELVMKYNEIAAKPIQEERRRLWSAHNSLKGTSRIPLIAQAGRWSKWCMEYWRDENMKCTDPFFREYERNLRIGLFQFDVGDDTIQEPWVTVSAVQSRGWGTYWGVQEAEQHSGVADGAWKFEPVIKEWDDLKRLSPPPHEIDEEATRKNVERLHEAIGDLITINVERGAICQGFSSDISTGLARLRGLEQVMMDLYESPDELKELISFMSAGILANNTAAERAGDYSLTSQVNQELCYSEELERPKANSGPRSRKDLWGFCASQEFTLISPEMHEEFLFNHQFPIYEQFGQVAYGCCEDLGKKISTIKRLPNLRVIAVSPWADIVKCADQIGKDYVYSWRPNPTDQVCTDWNEGRIRKILSEGIAATRGCHVHIHLKDTETLQGDPSRLARWVKIAREVSES